MKRKKAAIVGCIIIAATSFLAFTQIGASSKDSAGAKVTCSKTGITRKVMPNGTEVWTTSTVCRKEKP